MSDFHLTVYGKEFYEYQLPMLIKSIEKLSPILELLSKRLYSHHVLPQKMALCFTWEEIAEMCSAEISSILGRRIKFIANFDDECYWALKIIGDRIPIRDMHKVLDVLKATERQREDSLPEVDQRHLGSNEIGLEGGMLLLQSHLGYKWETEHITEEGLWLLGEKQEVPNET